MIHIFFVFQKPKVYAGNEKLKLFVDKNVPLLKKNYAPSPFYWEGRLQTILGLVYRDVYPPRFPYQRELLSLNDGGEIALDFSLVDTPKDG